MQLSAPVDVLLLTAVTTAVALLAAVALTRLYGLRAFAKMAPFDFAATIAIGSLLASTAAGAVPLLQGLVALGALYAVQRALAFARVRGARSLLDNAPLLLMAGDEVLRDNLVSGNVTEADLRSKLREANVLRLGQVRAVVLEATGDIAVLHGEADGPPLDPVLLEGVRGVPDEDRPSCWDADDLRG